MPRATASRPVKLSPDDLELLDEARQILGADTIVDAIRLMALTVVDASQARPTKTRQSTKTTTGKAVRTPTKTAKVPRATKSAKPK